MTGAEPDHHQPADTEGEDTEFGSLGPDTTARGAPGHDLDGIPLVEGMPEAAESIGMEWLAKELQPDGHQAEQADRGPAFGEVTQGRDGWLIKKSTEETYRARVASLWRAAAERKARLSGELEAPALIKPIDVVHYLKYRGLPQPGLPSLAESTWRAYRSALLWDFSRSNHPEFILACRELEQAVYPIIDHSGAAATAQTDMFDAAQAAQAAQKAARQKRGIPKADLVRLIDQLGGMNRHMKWGARVQYWLQAAIATGLRPGEWEFARWADDRQELLLAPILKAKADVPATVRHHRIAMASTHGTPVHKEPPTHLQMRAVPVEPSDRIFVAQHLYSIRQAAEMGFTFEEYQNYCRQTLWRACRQLWDGKKSYSLYQCRHQFSANSRSKMSRDELAAAMGHIRRGSTASYAGADRAHGKSPIAQRAAAQQAQAKNALAAGHPEQTQAQASPEAVQQPQSGSPETDSISVSFDTQ